LHYDNINCNVEIISDDFFILQNISFTNKDT